MNKKVVLLMAALSAIGAVAKPSAIMSSSSRENEKSWWMPRHEKKLVEIKEGPKEYDLVLVGDSISDFWSNEKSGGGKVLKARFGQYKILNLGVMGDRIENMMWRLENGEAEGYKAKVFQVLAGTNNIGKRASGEEVAAGVERIVRFLREKFPESRIILMPILPRADRKAGANAKERIDKANELIMKLADGDGVVIMDLRKNFLLETGELNEKLFKDALHPNKDGYNVWADTLEVKLAELLAKAGSAPAPLSGEAILLKGEDAKEETKTTESAAEAIAKYESGGELAVDPSEVEVAAPKDMKLILCIGQSNMAGRGALEPEDREIVPNAYKLNRDNKWVAAKSPYHFDRKYAAVGPVDDFVKLYLKDHPGETVGVVPCAVGGTSVKTWVVGASHYKRALERAKVAAENGKFIAILWHQGETDAAKYDVRALMRTYPGRVKDLAEALRKELGDETIPFIVGEIGRWERRDTKKEVDPETGKTVKTSIMADHAAKINPAINKIPEILSNSAAVSSEGLVNQDQHHFDRASQRILAQRYYEMFKKLAK